MPLKGPVCSTAQAGTRQRAPCGVERIVMLRDQLAFAHDEPRPLHLRLEARLQAAAQARVARRLPDQMRADADAQHGAPSPIATGWPRWQGRAARRRAAQSVPAGSHFATSAFSQRWNCVSAPSPSARRRPRAASPAPRRGRWSGARPRPGPRRRPAGAAAIPAIAAPIAAPSLGDDPLPLRRRHRRKRAHLRERRMPTQHEPEVGALR